MEKKQNLTLNLFKAFGCIGVVLVHCRFPEPAGTAFRAVGRFGVPFFFTISGFYLFPRGEWDAGALTKKARHIIGILCWAVPFYAVFAVFFARQDKDLVSWLREIASAGRLVKFFLSNEPLVYLHLWFLYALVFCYLFFLLFIHSRRQAVTAAWSAPVLLAVMALLQEFSFLGLVRNGIPLAGSKESVYLSSTILFRALPFMFLGILMREHEPKLSGLPVSAPMLLSVFLAGIGVSVWESFHFSVAQFYLGTHLAVISAMLLSIKYPNITCSPLGYLGEKLSLYIYVFHIAVYQIIDKLARTVGIAESMTFQWLRPAAAVFFSVLTADLIYKLTNRAVLRVRQKAGE